MVDRRLVCWVRCCPAAILLLTATGQHDHQNDHCNLFHSCLLYALRVVARVPREFASRLLMILIGRSVPGAIVFHQPKSTSPGCSHPNLITILRRRTTPPRTAHHGNSPNNLKRSRQRSPKARTSVRSL